MQANPSEAYACNAELYAEAGGLTGRHLFHPGQSLHGIGKKVLTTPCTYL